MVQKNQAKRKLESVSQKFQITLDSRYAMCHMKHGYFMYFEKPC